MTLDLRLLGSNEVKRNGQELSFPTERARLLLAYLALHAGTPLTRAHLAEVFWPDRPANAARHSLRTELNRLKQAIGDDGETSVIQATRSDITFAPSPQVTVDVHRFESQIEAVRRHPHDHLASCQPCIEALQQAVACYQGPFLANSLTIDSEAIERWQVEAQQRFESDMHWAYDKLIVALLETSRPEEAILLAQQLIELTPWYEPAHRNLMLARTLTGQRAAALRQFETLSKILAEELSIHPSAETIALQRQISADGMSIGAPQRTNPYQGLEAFDATDASLFFGRENATSRLYEITQRKPFVALIGPSGSGKSSVVQAGLLPQLGDLCTVITFRPGADPFRSLEEASAFLLPKGQPSWAWDTLVQQDAEEQATFFDQLTTALDAYAGEQRRCLLVVDQFEEIFTQCDNAQLRLNFFDLLLTIANYVSDGVAFGVLIALRADFMAQALATTTLANAFQDSTLILGAMNRNELQRAIERPALLHGVRFEPGLVDRLLDDVGSEPGNLPLLQFSLTLLWQEQKDGWLTHAAYEELERVVGALTHYASGVYARLQPAEQVQAQRIFLQLVQPGVGTVDTRRTATRVEIGEADWRLVQHLADRRLVVTNRSVGGEETVELVHEALIGEWKLLQSWMEMDREFRLWQQRVRVSLSQWESSAADRGTLLRGGPLVEAERWMQSRGEELSDPLRAFIRTSIEHRQRTLATVEEQQRRELAQAQALALAESQRAETEAQSSRRLRILAGGMAVVLGLAVLAALFAFQSQRAVVTQRNQAEEDARIALSRQLSAQSMRTAESHIDLALLLGLTATEIGLPNEDRTELMTEIDLPPMLKTVRQNVEAPVFDLAINPEGDTLFVRDDKGSVWRWDLSTPDRPATALIFQDDDIREVMFSAQGDRMAVNRVESVEIWDLRTQSITGRFRDHELEINSLNYSADGRYLITADDEIMLVRDAATGEVVKPPLPSSWGAIITFDGTTFVRVMDAEEGQNSNLQHVTFWNSETGEVRYDPDHGHTSDIHSLHFSPDGKILATASFDGSILLWDTETALQIGEPLRGHDGRVLVARFSPNGKMLVSGGVDGRLLVWHLQQQPDSAEMTVRLTGHSNWIRAINFSPDGEWMTTGDVDGRILYWRIADLQILSGHNGRARTVDLSPDGRTLISAGFDRTLGVWNAETAELLDLLPTTRPNAVINAKFSLDGDTVVSVDAGGAVIFWDTQDWTQRKIVPDAHEDVIIGIAFSPDGKTLATGDFAGVIRLWDVESAEPIGAPMNAHTWWALSLAFSPDGSLLASGGSDSTVKLWDVASQNQVGETLEGHTNWVSDLLFTPDGTQLLSASTDHSIRVWDVASGTAVGEPLVGHHAGVWELQFHPQGTTDFLVSGDDVGQVLRWDWSSRRPVGPALLTQAKSESMVLSPDGTTLFLGTFGPTIQRWSLSWDPWETQACAIANRALNDDETERYLHGAKAPLVCVE